jgi:L-fuconolactonase
VGDVIERIDAHHHVWDLTVRAQDWIRGEAMAPIARSFDVSELAVSAARHGIDGSIVVQSVADIEETEELLDLAGKERLVRGVVGYVDLTANDVGDQLDRLRERASGSALVGLRSLVQDEPDPDWLQRPEVWRGLRHVADRGLAFDLLIKPHQLPAAVATVAQLSDMRFVIDHLAKPAIGAGAWQPWATQMTRIAAFENVVAKVSGLVTEADWRSWTPSDLVPYVDHALEEFGAGRLMFGSDWPVCTLAAPYSVVVETTESLLAGLSEHERALVFGATAATVYGLHERARSDEPWARGAQT